MEATITYDEKTYRIVDGVVHVGVTALEPDGYGLHPAPKYAHETMRKHGMAIDAYGLWSGKLIPIVVADEAKRQLAELQAAKLAHIVGLAELRTAINTQVAYDEAFNAAVHRGDGRYPARPDVDVAALQQQYPIAAAYLHAEAAAHSAHYAHCAAGRKAMERIEAGEDHEAVLADMEAEWSAYVAEHAWD